MSYILSGAALLAMCGCSTGINPDKYNAAPAGKDAFVLCHGYGCTSKTPTGFSPKEWRKVAAIFKPGAKTPAEERQRIGRAIAQMERQVGAKTGTDEDAGAAVSLKTSTRQMDCIDETVNTTHYIEFLQAEGLLKFHDTAEPTHRGYIIDGRWPHNTAVIRELGSGELYAVDSFYRDNGGEPYIMPRQGWLDGWKPPGATQ